MIDVKGQWMKFSVNEKTALIAGIGLFVLAGIIWVFIRTGVVKVPKAPITQENLISVEFTVNTPRSTRTGDDVYLELLTFLGEIRSRHKMEKVGQFLRTVKVDVPQGALLRYRYSRSKEEVFPDNSSPGDEVFDEKLDVGFRLTRADGHSVSDTIALWRNASRIPVARGTLTGWVTDTDGNPVIDEEVSISGIQIYTDYQGHFSRSDIPAGSHELAVYALDGEFVSHFETVEIKRNEETTLNITVTPAKETTIAFVVKAPSTLPSDAVVRIIGSVPELGTVGIFENRLNIYTDRMKPMVRQGNRMVASIKTYEGHTIEYRYTLGDQFNGLEQLDSSQWRTVVVKEKLEPFVDSLLMSEDQKFVRFEVKVPDEPSDDILYFVTGPTTPMNKIGKNKWSLVLPTHEGEEIQYQYMHGDIYIASFEEPSQEYWASLPRKYSEENGHEVEDVVRVWPFMQRESLEFELSELEITERPEWISGAYFSDWWADQFSPNIDHSLDHVEKNNWNWVTASRIYQVSQIDPFLEIESRSRSLFSLQTPPQDLENLVTEAHGRGLKVFLHPQIISENLEKDTFFENKSNEWHTQAFEAMEPMILMEAHYAQELGVDMLLFEAPPQRFTDTEYASVYDAKMRELIAKVRNIYNGPLIGEIGRGDGYQFEFISDLDYIGIKWWEPLLVRDDASIEDITKAHKKKLIDQFEDMVTHYNKPAVITQIAYFGVDGSANGENEGGVGALGPFDTDFDEQARVYEGFFRAAAEIPWIHGFFSFGYSWVDLPSFPDSSVRGKPAEEVISVRTQEFVDSIK